MNGCMAIPAASLHGWRTDRSCASTANTTIECAGVEYPVCKIHEAVWERASDEHRRELAEKWGWTPLPAYTIVTNPQDHPDDWVRVRVEQEDS